MNRFFAIVTFCAAAISAAAGFAESGLKISCKYGLLTVIGDQVVATNDEQYGKRLWFVEKRESRTLLYTYVGENKVYMTANQEGRVFVTQKPTEGSFWGAQFPKKNDDERVESWITCGIKPGPRRLIAEAKEATGDVKGKGEAVAARAMRLGEVPDPEYGPADQLLFFIRRIAP
jgi:hypothetical protein